jgi:hypothetical protein
MRLLKITIVLLIFSLVACKKENNYPIIEPGSYFPVYPDSYWKYLVNDSIVIIDSTNDNYELNHEQINYSYNDYTEYCYTPLYNASNGSPLPYSFYAYKYGRYVYNALTPTQIWPFLSETIGYVFTLNPISQYPVENELFIVKAKIFNGHDSVLIQEGTYFMNNYPQFTNSLKIYQEFVKEVGLFKEIIYDTISGDTVSKKILIDYYISHKTDL